MTQRFFPVARNGFNSLKNATGKERWRRGRELARSRNAAERNLGASGEYRRGRETPSRPRGTDEPRAVRPGRWRSTAPSRGPPGHEGPFRSAAEGEHDMSYTTLRRYLTVGVLAAVLSAAGAPPASARDVGTAGRAWLWLQDVWTQGVSILWHGAGAGDSGSKVVPSWAKQGYGVDPNGGTPPRPSSVTPPCGSTCPDQGPGLDPNG